MHPPSIEDMGETTTEQKPESKKAQKPQKPPKPEVEVGIHYDSQQVNIAYRYIKQHILKVSKRLTCLTYFRRMKERLLKVKAALHRRAQKMMKLTLRGISVESAVRKSVKAHQPVSQICKLCSANFTKSVSKLLTI